MTKCIVYGLYSSREPDVLRYVGQTTQLPKFRLAQHRNYAKRKQTAVHKWFLREVFDGFVISLRVLVEGAVFNVTEIELIELHRRNGAQLLNLTDGGEGTVGWIGNRGIKRPDLAERNRRNKGKPGHPMSEDNKKKLMASLADKPRPWIAERNRSMKGMPGHPHTEQSRARISAGNKGKIINDETRKKISIANTGKKRTPEQIIKIIASQKERWAAWRNANA